MRLNLGCGSLILPDAVNVDIYEGPGIDVVHDLDEWPWPFEDEQFDDVLALDIYEHVDEPLAFVNELWRVTQMDGSIRLRTTYWNTKQSFTDPTHKRWLTEQSFDYWIPGTDFHRRYGAGYSGGRHFKLQQVWLDGNELEWRLIRKGRCDGACG